MAPEQAYDEAYATAYRASLTAAYERGLYGADAAAYAHRYALRAANAAERSVRALAARDTTEPLSAPPGGSQGLLRPLLGTARVDLPR